MNLKDFKFSETTVYFIGGRSRAKVARPLTQTLCLKMNKPICIECGTCIKLHQLFNHSWKKPIVCHKCGTKLNFDKNEWKQAFMPAAISAYILLAIIVLSSLVSKNIALILLIISLLTVVATSIRFGVKLSEIKLVRTNKT